MMKIFLKIIAIVFMSIALAQCSVENTNTSTNTDTNVEVEPISRQLKYLALGDSYTIGESVCETCRFPEQLKSGLESSYPNDIFSLKIIATTGWTTTNLITAINSQNPDSNYDLVTLLIGVNNQYQRKPFSIYEQEFPELVATGIRLAKGDKSKLLVVSIPDYAYTPFGKAFGSNNASVISTDIQRYNTFAKNYCVDNAIEFINITDITQQGFQNPDLVAIDGLHPSELAYSKFVERILPKAVAIISK
jgi:lysophospholipase L1-like esterase